jgi:MFS superfamily sulfate permease-like transporter
LAGYKKPPTESTERKDDVAESHSRVRSWGTVAAFTLIVVLTVAEGVDEGFSVWDWLVIAVGVVFILQALFRLKEARSAPS